MRILLTTVFRPFGIENKYNKKGDEHLLDYLASRLTRETGLFSLSSYLPHSGLHIIAANLPVESKVLEYFTQEEFVEEIKKGYDYIGISFMYKGYRKVFQMISLTRKHSPKTKIVLGGVATDIHNVKNMGADYVCKGEGVSFMRKLLGFSNELKVVNPEITAEVTLKVLQNYDFINKPRMGLVVSGFGCPTACEFCCTSAYYDHKHIPFLESGAELYYAMLNMHKNGVDKVSDFLIFEEDFMLYEDRVKGLGKLIQKDKENTFSFACFASVRSLSNYDLEELVSMGMGHVWIGVESVDPTFEKRQGRDIKDIFNELHSLGVTTTGSSIFGLDHHTPDKLTDEVDFVISLSPSTNQFSCLMPGLRTQIKARLEKENRLREFSFKDTDLYSEVIKHPQFKPGEITEKIFAGYERVYNALGPSIYRIIDTWFTGYKNLKDSPNGLLRNRAKLYATKIKGTLPVFLNTSQYLPNDEIRSKVNVSIEEILSEFGDPTSKQKEAGALIGKIFALEDEKRKYIDKKPIEPVTWETDYDSRFHKDYCQKYN